MADGGITEAALLAAAADTAAAGGTAAATAAAAAALPEVASAGAGLLGTAAAAAPEVAAATVPEIAAAAPEAFATAAPEVAAATDAAADPIFLGASQSVPEAGAVPAAGAVTEPTASSAAGGLLDAPSSLHSAAWQAGTGQFADPTVVRSPSLLAQLGNWWDTASAGDKLSAGGKLLSGVGTATSAAQAATPKPAPGPSHTIQPGAVGRPQGGEQQLAALVDAMLKKRDAYQQGQLGGAPIAYRPRGLLG